MLFCLLEVVAKPVYQLVAALDGIVSIVGLIINIISVIVFLVWLNRLHADLRNLFKEYPISPGGAIARFIIPIYSIWGIANTLYTFANKFEAEGGDLTSLGKDVRSSVGPIYAFMFGTNALNRFIFREATKNPPDAFLPVWYLLSSVLDIGYAAIFLALTKTMRTAVIQKSKRVVC